MGPRPKLFLLALPLALCWGLLIFQLSAQWWLFEQYNYGWAVPGLCLYLAWTKVGHAVPCAPSTETPPTETPNHRSAFARVLILACAFALLPIRVLHEANPVWRLTSWAWALSVIGLTLGMLYLAGGRRWLRDYWFPVAFFLVAIPWPTPIEHALVQGFTRANTGATVEIVNLLGIPAMQHGNVIEVGTGAVGVDDACSGIRSFQATLMIALFFGGLYRLSVLRCSALCLSGFGLSFLFNVVRTTLLTTVAAKQGVAAISKWHDPAGVAILLGCFLSLWGIGVRLSKTAGRAATPRAPAEPPEPETLNRDKETADSPYRTHSSETIQLHDPHGLHGKSSPPRSAVCGLSSMVSVLIAVWILAVEIGNEAWYRWHETRAAGPQWKIDPAGLGERVERIQLPKQITGQFNADESLHLRWADSQGNEWMLYYFRWEPSTRLKRRVAANLAKVHGPETCLAAAGLGLVEQLPDRVLEIQGFELKLQQSVYQREGQKIHVFYAIYEDARGPEMLANRRPDASSRLQAALQGSRASGQRFLEIGSIGPNTPEQAREALVRQLGNLIKSSPKS